MCKALLSILLFKLCIAFLRAEEVTRNDISESHLKDNSGGFEEESVTWNKFMTKASWATHQIIDHFQPNLKQILTSGNISTPCVKSLQLYFNGMKKWEPWAVKMFDANGKIPSGIMMGTMMNYGSFDQCMQVRAESKDISEPFRGQYCMVRLRTPLIRPMDTKTPRNKSYVEDYGNPPDWITEFMQIQKGHLIDGALCIGICLPSTCSEKDLYNFFSSALKPWLSEIYISNCQDDTPKPWSSLSVAATWTLAALFAVCILGTIVDKKDQSQQPKPNENVTPINEGFGRSLLKSFSLTANAAEVLKKRVKSTPFDSLDGIRVFLSFWIITGHTLVIFEHLKEWKHSHKNNLFTSAGYSTVILENTILSMEFFMVMSGLLLISTMRNKFEKNGGKINLIEFIAKKYFRLLPALIFAVLMMFAIPVLSNGPVWNSTWDLEIEKCRNSFWKNALFIPNFSPGEEVCLNPSWYLGNLMQANIAGFILLHIIFRFRKTGIVISLLTVILCVSMDYMTSLRYEFLMIQVNQVPNFDMFKDYISNLYYRPTNHFSSFLCGMALGWILLKYKDVKLSTTFRVICWVASISCFVFILFAIWIPTRNFKFIASYHALRNVFWALSVCWVFYSFFTGYGGVLNRFFASEYFVQLSRISYSIYIFHPLVIYYRAAIRRETGYLGFIELTFDSLSIIVLSCGLAFIGHIMVELPFISLYDKLYKKFTSDETSKQTQNAKHKSN